jgi:hypothetical protein
MVNIKIGIQSGAEVTFKAEDAKVPFDGPIYVDQVLCTSERLLNAGVVSCRAVNSMSGLYTSVDAELNKANASFDPLGKKWFELMAGGYYAAYSVAVRQQSRVLFLAINESGSETQKMLYCRAFDA